MELQTSSERDTEATRTFPADEPGPSYLQMFPIPGN